MHWVLQHNMFVEAGFQRLIDTLERFSLSYTMHKVIPFVGVLSPPLKVDEDYKFEGEYAEDTEFELPAGPKIVMGSYSMALYARRKGWTPGSFDSIDLDYERQLPHWGKEMLNSDALVCRFREVPRPRAWEFFIRPTLDSKSFTGVVTDWAAFEQWQARVIALGSDNGGTLDGDTMVQVCSKKVIYREYRLWVVQGKIVTASLYKEGGRARYSDQVDADVLRYAAPFTGHPMIRDSWAPAEAFVLDIAETPDGFKILEAGCINAAGFYAADMQKLVMALEGGRWGSTPAPEVSL